MSPVPQLSSTFSHPNIDAILTSLHKRSSDCAYYETSCSTHRLAIMVIIIFIGILVSAILSLLYVRSRKSKAAKLRASLQQRQKVAHTSWQTKSQTGERFETTYDLPPAYEPRRPERAARTDERWT